MQGFKRYETEFYSKKMPLYCTMFLIVLMLFSFVNSDDSFVSVMASDKRTLDSETSEVFNKTLASKDRSKFLRGARTPTPPTRAMPSYSPPSRILITPALPPEYLHPFADKPMLRGSNSDSMNVGNRRPIPPPPPISRLPPEELIPIRPPDLGRSDSKKKTLNTKKVADVSTYSEMSSTTNSNSRVNETFDFFPILPYPSVSRILSVGNGRKHDVLQDILERTRIEHDKEPRTIKQEIVKTLIPPVKQDDVKKTPSEPFNEEKAKLDESQQNENKPKEPVLFITEPSKSEEEAQKQEVLDNDVVESEAAPQPERSEPRTRHVLGIAWDVHVYLIATLFAMLALCSLINIFRLTYCKHLLSQGYFLSVHGILLIIGCMRSFYLFFDAYNIRKTLPEAVSSLLLNMVFPLLTSAFAILFLFLLIASEVKAMNNKLQRASFLAVFILLHLAVSFSVHLYANDTPYPLLLPLICQCIFIILCVGLGLAYLYMYKSLSQSCIQKTGHMYSGECERWSLSHAVRVTLATAMLSLLMAAVQLYGMLGDYEALTENRPQVWLWWGFHLSVRVIEISMCALMAWAGMQRDTSSLPEQPASVEDIYPTICTTNQAYTMRSAKHYDDTFPLNSLHVHAHTAERRSIKKHPSLDRRLQPSPSMLVAENGFVRFRTIADAEIPDDAYTAANSIHEFA